MGQPDGSSSRLINTGIRVASVPNFWPFQRGVDMPIGSLTASAFKFARSPFARFPLPLPQGYSLRSNVRLSPIAYCPYYLLLLITYWVAPPQRWDCLRHVNQFC
jgi:hypothetical protein